MEDKAGEVTEDSVCEYSEGTGADLESLAMQELLLEAKRGAERAKVMGAAGWMKPVIPPTNKRFLERTIKSTLPSKRSKIDECADSKRTTNELASKAEKSKRHEKDQESKKYRSSDSSHSSNRHHYKSDGYHRHNKRDSKDHRDYRHSYLHSSSKSADKDMYSDKNGDNKSRDKDKHRRDSDKTEDRQSKHKSAKKE